MIYQLSFNRYKFLVADIPLEEIYEKHGTYYPFQDEHEQELESWQAIWKPLNIRFYNDSDSNITAIPDITCWFTDQLIMNDKAFKHLKEPLKQYGEWLPTLCENIPYWLFHVNLKTDLSYVDNNKSQRNIDETGFIEVTKLGFLKNKVESLLIFKSQFNNYENIYCNQTFKDLSKTTNLKA